jgi:hypothetical protein
MRIFSGSRPLLLGLALFVPLLTGANGSGCGAPVVIGNDNTGGGTSSTTTGSTSSGSSCDCGAVPPLPMCLPGEANTPVCEQKPNQTCSWVVPACTPVCNCPALPAIAEQCPDGTTVGPECVVAGNTCEVVFPPCPPDPCPPSACGTPPPGPLCPGGSNATILCVPGPNKVCGWVIGPCPPPKTCTPSDCGVMPTIVVECNGTPLSPVCEPDAQSNCGWVIPPCLADGGACPQPHPENCQAIIDCKCLDGTAQIGGCVNGFTCPEACCGHGGSM